MKMKILSVLAIITMALTGPAFGQGAPSRDGAKVYFVNLADGDEVTGPVRVVFGLSGMGVAPAGTEKEFTGHHHLLIDRPPLGQGPDGPYEFDYSLPANENLMHFGGGQTEVVLDLAPGEHTLQLVLADMSHVPHSAPVMSEVITITVE